MKKKRRTGVITGLILGGAVASVVSMLFVSKKKKSGVKKWIQSGTESTKGFWKKKRDQE